MTDVLAHDQSQAGAQPTSAPPEETVNETWEVKSVHSQFLASMGHTLRTPLNGILGFANLLSEGIAGELTDRQLKYVNRIADSGERQLQLINNLVDLARIQAGQPIETVGTCDLATLIDETLGTYAPQVKEKQLDIELDVDERLCPLDAGPDGLQKVVDNLVTNAVRHSEQGGVISISVKRQTQGDGSVSNGSTPAAADTMVLCIADTGPGISQEDAQYLFDDCEHAEAMDARRQRRSGVGMALSRRIVEAHGGRIWLESEGTPGKGSRFFVELPTCAPSEKTI